MSCKWINNQLQRKYNYKINVFVKMEYIFE